MLNSQKPSFDKTGLGFFDLCPTTPSTPKSLGPRAGFVPQPDKAKPVVLPPKVDKGKQVIGTMPKNTPHIFTPKKPSYPHTSYVCHHCGKSGSTRPSCFKWLASQEKSSSCVSMPTSKKMAQNVMSLLGELVKALSPLTQV